MAEGFDIGPVTGLELAGGKRPMVVHGVAGAGHVSQGVGSPVAQLSKSPALTPLTNASH